MEKYVILRTRLIGTGAAIQHSFQVFFIQIKMYSSKKETVPKIEKK